MRIFSGIQPTGAKHLGNYAGGFRQYVETQEQGEAFFCIVDLHSVSVEHDPQELRERTLDVFAMLIATGLDPGPLHDLRAEPRARRTRRRIGCCRRSRASASSAA